MDSYEFRVKNRMIIEHLYYNKSPNSYVEEGVNLKNIVGVSHMTSYLTKGLL